MASPSTSTDRGYFLSNVAITFGLIVFAMFVSAALTRLFPEAMQKHVYPFAYSLSLTPAVAFVSWARFDASSLAKVSVWWAAVALVGSSIWVALDRLGLPPESRTVVTFLLVVGGRCSFDRWVRTGAGTQPPFRANRAKPDRGCGFTGEPGA